MSTERVTALQIRTPEGIVFPLHLAGPVTRCLAWSLDFVVILGLSNLAATVLKLLVLVSGDLGRAVMLIAYFVISVGYHILLEWSWRGQTLGKRLLRLRVMDEQGLNMHFSQIVIRNLVRVIDMILAFYLVGGAACLLSGKAQRLGDIAAGTIVVRQPKRGKPDFDQLLAGKYNSLRDYPHLAARLRQLVSPREAYLALEALMRRDELDPDRRVEVYREIAAHFRSRVPFPDKATFSLSDEQELRNVVDLLFRTRRGAKTNGGN